MIRRSTGRGARDKEEPQEEEARIRMSRGSRIQG
jgi:hypothetical protein